MCRKISKHLMLFVVLAFSLTKNSPVYASKSIIAYAREKQYQTIDRDFTHFSTEFFYALVRHKRSGRYRNINSLLNSAQEAYHQHDPVRTNRLIIGNTRLIEASINTKAVIGIESLLLKTNALHAAERLFKLINNESDPSIITNVQFSFAKYYYAHDQWKKTIRTINTIANDLPRLDFQHAMLIQGISLQNLEEHRKALLVYKKISSNSTDYVAARINMAVANIRQDWWTDAYDILTKLLDNPKVRKNKTLTDRIHTVIGYTFLQQEYFRNSRNAFRKVELHGVYTNQALLGIALDAGYQKDYVGALNACRFLKNKHSDALQVDEAHLLLPYFYEKLGQMATASAGYTDAIKYYEGRLRHLKTAMTSSPDYFRQVGAGANSTLVNINGQTVDLGEYLPPAFFTQLSLLKTFRNEVNSLGETRIRTHYQRLVSEFIALIHKIVQMDLKKKSGYISDYMNQCRYGLARLYDKNLSDAK